MMYHMKKIIVHDKEIVLPNCMYSVKYRTDVFKEDDSDINISNQGSNKMSELEQRQEQLLKKLDTLYDRIKMISSHCKDANIQDVKTSKPGKCVRALHNKNKEDFCVRLCDCLDLLSYTMNLEAVFTIIWLEHLFLKLPAPEEVVLVLSPDSLPWYLNTILKESPVALNISWHIHSSVPNEKVPKIKNYVKNIQASKNNSKINLRLIFKCVSADTELKLSTLDVPIVGNVNILRYLSYVYPSVIPYNANDHHVDYLLDLCHMLERTPEKNKEVVVMKLFSQQKNWIYGNEFSIVDLAAYNVIKQWKNIPKYVPKPWLDKCNKLFV